jgi:hypothetical protein
MRSASRQKTAATTRSRKSSSKVGESRRAAASFGGKGDFGAPEASENERNYASSATRNQDPGTFPGHSLGEGTRDTGVGGNESGTGSSSGGDVDTDIIGVGQGGSTISVTGPDDRTHGPDMVSSEQNPSDTFAAPGKKGRKGRNVRERVRGTTIDRTGGDASTTQAGQGAASVTNPDARNDDAFAGEISNGEASGADNSSSDDQ